jgi:thiamine transport system substrate-binding protein
MKKWILLLGTMLLFLVGCGGQAADSTPVEEETAGQETAVTEPTAETPQTLTVMSHDSFAISEEVIKAFEEEHNAQIVLLPSGDAGAALNQAILAKDNPLADVFFGVDNTFMSRALDAGIFVPYESPMLAEIDDTLKLDASSRLLPVDFGDVCLNYDIAYFEENGLTVPQSLDALTDPAYADLLVVENPATSSPGLAFLLATIAQFGEDGYLDYWQALRDNGVLVVNGWEDAYYGHFTVASDGERPLVVSYASSPPAEFIFADPPVEAPPSASITAPGTCFRQVEFVGILAGTQNEALAQAFIDYMLSVPFQEDIPLNMFVFPANTNAALPEAFIDWAQLSDQPAAVDPALIEANRETWIEAWTNTVLR